MVALNCVVYDLSRFRAPAIPLPHSLALSISCSFARSLSSSRLRVVCGVSMLCACAWCVCARCSDDGALQTLRLRLHVWRHRLSRCVRIYTQSPMHALTHMHSLIRPLHVYSHEFTHMHSHTHSFFTRQRARAHTHRAAAAGDDRADGCHFIL